MDVWVFAAAASAGYVAQQLRHLNIGNRKWPNCSYDINKSGRAGTPAFIHKAMDQGDQFQREGICSLKELHSDESCAEAAASGSGFEGEDLETWDEVCDSGSSSGFENAMVDSRDVPNEVEEVMASGSSCHPSIIEIGFSFGSRQVKYGLRCKGVNREYVKPQTSLESCLQTHFWNSESRIEEHAYSVHASWKAVLHTLPVSGSRILNRPHFGWFSETLGSGNNNLLNKSVEPAHTVLGIPKLPDIALKKSVFAARNIRSQALVRSNVNTLVPGDIEKTEGSSNGLALFYLGMMIGVLSTSSVSLWEMEKLRKSLKYTENLVQDLHEELEMKDSLTVRELTTENDELQDSSNLCVDDNSQIAPHEQMEGSSIYQDEEEESFKKIEAELDAEWDRFQSNVSLFQVENNLADICELSPDFIPDIAEGELKAECFSPRAESSIYPERCTSSVPTPTLGCNQYPVSPRLLSLKLHEVIQSRLIDRIKQLETALENMKSSESPDSRKVPDFEAGSLSSSPERLQSIEQPVVIHLPGEALAPYYEELPINFSESDKEESGNHEVMLIQEKQQVGFDVNPEQHIVLTDDCGSWNESDIEDDEMERLLIQQIVEKARQGSPAILKAKWAMLSTDTSSYRQEPDVQVAETGMEESDFSYI